MTIHDEVENELTVELLQLEANVNQQILEFEKKWKEKHYFNVMLLPMDQIHPGYDKIVERGGRVQFARATTYHPHEYYVKLGHFSPQNK